MGSLISIRGARLHRSLRWVSGSLLLAVLYVLSSGPVVGLSWWLCETTRDDRWYQMMWLYYPLWKLVPYDYIDWYIGWWVVEVFDTGPPQ